MKKALVTFGSWKGRIVEILYKYIDAYSCKYYTNKTQVIISTLPMAWLKLLNSKLELE